MLTLYASAPRRSAANLVLQDTVERVFVGNRYGDIARGVFLVRGENVVLMGEIVSFHLPRALAHRCSVLTLIAAAPSCEGSGRRGRSATIDRRTIASISAAAASGCQGGRGRVQSKERSKEGRRPPHSPRLLRRQERRRRHLLDASHHPQPHSFQSQLYTKQPLPSFGLFKRAQCRDRPDFMKCDGRQCIEDKESDSRLATAAPTTRQSYTWPAFASESTAQACARKCAFSCRP